jgi:hypothetical protein
MPARDYQTGSQDLQRLAGTALNDLEWLQMHYDPDYDILVSDVRQIIAQTWAVFETTGFAYIANANAALIPWGVLTSYGLHVQLRAQMLMRNLDGPGAGNDVGVACGVEIRSVDLGDEPSSEYLDWVVDLDPATSTWSLERTDWGGPADWQTTWGGSSLPAADYLLVTPQLWVDDDTRGQVLGLTAEMRVLDRISL